MGGGRGLLDFSTIRTRRPTEFCRSNPGIALSFTPLARLGVNNRGDKCQSFSNLAANTFS